jgi:hypothetical protein
MRKFDVPIIVADLEDSVFDAVLNASVEQMEAYADLINQVSDNADDFVKENEEAIKEKTGLPSFDAGTPIDPNQIQALSELLPRLRKLDKPFYTTDNRCTIIANDDLAKAIRTHLVFDHAILKSILKLKPVKQLLRRKISY